MSDERDVPQNYFGPYAHNTIGAFPCGPPLRPIPTSFVFSFMGLLLCMLCRFLSSSIEQEHGWSYLERAPTSWPLGFSRLPELVPPVMLFDPMDTRSRMTIHQFLSSPMFPATQSSTWQLGSQLIANKQAAVLKKLRKDIYDSSPRRFTRKISTYYHDQSSTHTRLDAWDDDIDSKKCVVCLEDFKSGEEVTITPYNHMFQENCMPMPGLSLLPVLEGDSP